jgi:hypothetical protein
MMTSIASGGDDATPAFRRRRPHALLGKAAGLVGLLAALGIGATELYVSGALSSPSNRLDVGGRVLFDGRPIGHGHIEFVPQMIADVEADFTPGKARIKDGDFDIPAREGLCPGVYLLRIRSLVVETHSYAFEGELRQPQPDQPCERAAPIIVIRPDSRNRFEIRLE